jgi:hypothetical protein
MNKAAMPAKPQSVTQLLGVPAVLPGESAAHYKASLAALVSELQATTALQVYLAEKIHECLWWIRRYEAQKRNTVVAEMAAITNVSYSADVTPTEERVRNALASNQVNPNVAQVLKELRHTPESLQQKAMANKALALQGLDQQIALQTKILAGLQASYEVAFNRNANVERLQLQNSLLRRNLQAIDMVPIQADTVHGKP